MKVFAASQARQQFSNVLDCAQKDGGVQIKRRDGGVFLIQPVYASTSPLSVKGVDLNLTKNELLSFIQEGRRV
jgi:antitoxin Phd